MRENDPGHPFLPFSVLFQTLFASPQLFGSRLSRLSCGAFKFS